MAKLREEDLFIYIDLKDMPLFKGYMFIWCIRAYCFYYYSLQKRMLKTLRVGNIFESFMNIFKGFVYAQRLVVQNLDKERLMALRAYGHLTGFPLNY